MNIHTWLFRHVRWFYKWASGPCYNMNCEVENLTEEIRTLIKKLEEQQDINKLIETHTYQ